jgi:hypothetical protein
MTFVSVFVTPVVLMSRWWSLAIAVWTFVAALFTVAATVIATAMFIIFKNVITSQQALNIGASIGTQMFAFMWIAAGFNLLGFGIHLGLTCCCASTRDVRTRRRTGSKKAYRDGVVDLDEKKGRRERGMMARFGRKKTRGGVV